MLKNELDAPLIIDDVISESTGSDDSDNSNDSDNTFGNPKIKRGLRYVLIYYALIHPIIIYTTIIYTSPAWKYYTDNSLDTDITASEFIISICVCIAVNIGFILLFHKLSTLKLALTVSIISACKITLLTMYLCKKFDLPYVNCYVVLNMTSSAFLLPDLILMIVVSTIFYIGSAIIF